MTREERDFTIAELRIVLVLVNVQKLPKRRPERNGPLWPLGIEKSDQLGREVDDPAMDRVQCSLFRLGDRALVGVSKGREPPG